MAARLCASRCSNSLGISRENGHKCHSWPLTCGHLVPKPVELDGAAATGGAAQFEGRDSVLAPPLLKTPPSTSYMRDLAGDGGWTFANIPLRK